MGTKPQLCDSLPLNPSTSNNGHPCPSTVLNILPSFLENEPKLHSRTYWHGILSKLSEGIFKSCPLPPPKKKHWIRK